MRGTSLIAVVAAGLLAAGACTGPEPLADEARPRTSTSPRSGPERGIYLWDRTAARHPAGRGVIGDRAREAAAVEEFARLGVARVYSAVVDRPADTPEVVAAWNRRLHAAGMSSHLLMAENTWLFQCNHGDLAELLRRRLLDFNAGRSDPAERFDGVHLDIEPHGLRGVRDCDEGREVDWGRMRPDRKRGYVRDLPPTLRRVRREIGPDLALHADIALWVDELYEPDNPEQGFYWTSRDDAADWFRSLAASVDGLTVMAYCRTGDRLADAVADEIALFDGEVRVGLSARAVAPATDGCPKSTWTSVSDLVAGGAAVERHLGDAIGGVDFYSYSWLMDRREGR